MSFRPTAVLLPVSIAVVLMSAGCASVHRPDRTAAFLAEVDSPVSSLALLQNYRTERVSSADREGNADFRRIQPRETLTLADLRGPGEITHIWMTISSKDTNHLRDLVLRIYYDGHSFPSVESPVGDFFGLGHGRYYVFNNPVQAIGTKNGMSCFWPMPFRKSVRIEVTNESDIPTRALYYYIDWRSFRRFPRGLAYFQAQYRQAFPCPDKKPYTILETEGCPGHYVGVSLSVHTEVSGWWGEGDDIFTIDGEAFPSLWGTGSEDYFCGAWCYGDTFYTNYFGMPYREKPDQSADNYWNVYRLHLENPVTFRKSLKVQIEHGSSGFNNTRKGGHNNDYSSVAYWYMKKPVRLIGSLPPASDRISTYRPLEAPANVVDLPSSDWVTTPSRKVKVQHQDMTSFEDKGRGKWCLYDQVYCARNIPGSISGVPFTLDKARKGPLLFILTQAPDYACIRVRLDDKVVIPNFNAYHPKVRSVVVHAGDIDLAKGRHTVTVETLGKDPKADNFLWGIDCFRIGGEPLDFEDTTPVVSGNSGSIERTRHKSR